MDEKAFLAFLRQRANCCLCEGSMARTTQMNMVSIDKKAGWKWPVWSNLLVENCGDRAVALVCDGCVESRMKPGVRIDIKYAVEISAKEVPVKGGLTRTVYEGITYHKVEDLEDAFPITEEMIEEGERKRFGLKFVAS